MAEVRKVVCDSCRREDLMVPGSANNYSIPAWWVSLRAAPHVYGRTVIERENKERQKAGADMMVDFASFSNSLKRHIRTIVGEFLLCPNCAGMSQIKAPMREDHRLQFFQAGIRKLQMEAPNEED